MDKGYLDKIYPIKCTSAQRKKVRLLALQAKTDTETTIEVIIRALENLQSKKEVQNAISRNQK